MFFKIDIAYITGENAKRMKQNGQDVFHREDVVIRTERINPRNIVRYHEAPHIDGKTLIFFVDGVQALVDYTPEEIDTKISQAQIQPLRN